MISLKHLTNFLVCVFFVSHAHGMIIDQIPDSHDYIYDPVLLPEGGNITGNITTNPLPTPNGVTFLGVGYNILTGNPEGGDINTGGVDPGLLTTRKIFKLTYDENNLSNDLRYQVPDEVVFAPRDSCVTTQSQEVFYGTKSYQKKIGVDVGVSLGVPGPYSFSLSSRYQQVKSKTESSNYIYYEERTVCNKGQARYRTELASHEQFPLDEGFVADACRLTAAYDNNLYMYFLEDWGTHVVSEVDVGTKTTERYEEEEQRFVNYAMTEIGNSISAEYGVKGFGVGIRVDMNLFKQGLTSEMQFGRKTHTYTSGSDDMHEPIGILLLDLFEVFDERYWQLFDEYVEAGLCPPTWFNNSLTSIKINVETAINGYAEWNNGIPSNDPIVEIPVTWPQDTYGLPKPTSGCPNSHFTWAEGRRFQDTENIGGDNNWSNPCHLDGQYGNHDAEQVFCMKVQYAEDVYEWSWPEGQYCIFRKADECPAGMSTGWLKWDDENNSNNNKIEGEVPDGVYDKDTKIEYCCQISGSASNPIYLPVDDSFFLMKYNHQCQEVYGMKYTEEFFRWDTQNTNNQNKQGDVRPYKGKNNGEMYIEYCYYEPDISAAINA